MNQLKPTVIALPAFQDNYIWIWLQDITSIVAVDPGDAAPVLNFVQQHQLRVSTILLTHHHHDHIGGVADLLLTFPECQVYGPEDNRIQYPRYRVSTPKQDLPVGNGTFKVLKTPGHTSSHICYYEPTFAWLFCGDTLFSAGCGRVFDGTMEALFASLQQINQLPENTQVFCAHEYTRANLNFAKTIEPHNQAVRDHLQLLQQNPASCSLPSTLKLERLINPFIRAGMGLLSEFAIDRNLDPEDKLSIFRCLREMKNQFT